MCMNIDVCVFVCAMYITVNSIVVTVFFSVGQVDQMQNYVVHRRNFLEKESGNEFQYAVRISGDIDALHRYRT